MAQQAQPQVSELTPEQIKLASDAYFAHILDEDEEKRLEGFHELDPDHAESALPNTPRQTFEEHLETQGDFEAGVKADYARGRTDEFFKGEAEELLSWEGIEIRLDPWSPSWKPLIRAMQEATIKASKGVRERDGGEVIPTPPVMPQGGPRAATVSTYPLYSEASLLFLEEGSRGGWTDKTKRDYSAWLRDFAEAVCDRPIDKYSKADGRTFKVILSKLPANRKKKKQLSGLTISRAAETGSDLGMPPMSLENANKAMNRISTFWKWADSNYFDEPGPAPLAGMGFKLQDALQDKFEVMMMEPRS